MKVEREGLLELKSLIDKVNDAVSSIDITERIAGELLLLSYECFDNERDPFGEPWPKVSEKRQREKDKFGGTKILQGKTGDLKNKHLQTTFDENAAYLFANGVYAATHNNGAQVKHGVRDINQESGRRAGGVPQRMFIPNEGNFPHAWLERIGIAVAETIAELINK